MARRETTAVLVNGNSKSESSAFVRSWWAKDDRLRTLLVVLGAASLPVIIPYVHLAIISLLWKKYEFQVERATCANSCWDTVFKGQYESGVAAYKHVYFNVTSNTLKIWVVTVAYLLALYECGKRVIGLFFLARVRLPMLVLLIAVLYPHYYAWWSYFNYWNDEFYSQWYHQLYFSMTELVSTLFVVRLLDTSNIPHPRELLVIMIVAAFHVGASLHDQFLSNVFGGEGSLHQVLRDLGLMVPDLLHLWLPWRELRKMPRRPLSTLFAGKDILAAVAFLVFSCVCIMAF